MKTTTKHTVISDKASVRLARPAVLTIAVYTGLFGAWIALQLHK